MDRFFSGGRQLDGSVGNRWWEAKSSNYWDDILTNQKKLDNFKSTGPQCKQIAQSNGATYEIITNGQIPGTIKTWLDSKGIAYIELFY